MLDVLTAENQLLRSNGDLHLASYIIAIRRTFSTAILIQIASMRQVRTNTRRTSTSWKSFLKSVRTW